MPVIGYRESHFSVNARPTDSDVTPQNYGLIYDSSAIPSARPGRGPAEAVLEFCGMKFRAIEDPSGGMANRTFTRLP
jgi:hypothetical protein